MSWTLAGYRWVIIIVITSSIYPKRVHCWQALGSIKLPCFQCMPSLVHGNRNAWYHLLMPYLCTWTAEVVGDRWSLEYNIIVYRFLAWTSLEIRCESMINYYCTCRVVYSILAVNRSSYNSYKCGLTCHSVNVWMIHAVQYCIYVASHALSYLIAVQSLLVWNGWRKENYQQKVHSLFWGNIWRLQRCS